MIVEGQEYRRKLSEFQTSALKNVASNPADIRKRTILACVCEMKFDKDPYIEQFGIYVDSKMTQIQGQHLFSMFENYFDAITNHLTYYYKNIYLYRTSAAYA